MSDRRIAVAPRVRHRSLNGQSVAYSPQTDEVTRLDEIGTAVWALLNPTITQSELITTLHAHFGGDRDTIRNDIETMIDELASAKLIVLDSDAY